MPNERLFLLDASSYLFRAYYAIGSLSTSKGIPTNATYGFTQMLMRLIKDHAPSHLAAVWDRPEPTFRKKEFDAYKAHRKEAPEDLPEQIDWIKKILEAMRIPTLEKVGYEADDLIGTIVKAMEKKGIDVVVVTGDKDMMQLVSDKVLLLDTMKEKWTDRKGVEERFGVPPEKVVEIMGLTGDSIDNIPGVPGIGEKTATALIQQFGSLEGLYERISELKGKRREILEANREQAFLSRRLATLDSKVPMEISWESFRRSDPDDARLYELFKELEFSRLLPQLKVPKKISTKNYILVNTPETLKELVQELKGCHEFAFDTETTSLNFMSAEIVGLSFSSCEGRAYYVPVGHGAEEPLPQLPLKEVLEALKPVLEDPKIKKIGQDFKYDYQILRRAGIETQGLACDTRVAAYVLDPAGTHNLDQLSRTYLDHATIRSEEAAGGKKGVLLAQVSVEKVLERAGEDADVAFRLCKILSPKIREEKLTQVFEEIDLPLAPVLARMELSGIKIDRAFLKGLSDEFSGRMEHSQKRILELAGEEFNINSTKQLSVILFEKLKLPILRRTKTGYSTDMDVLTELAKMHDLPNEILSYRALAKLKSTYIDSLLDLADPTTDRVHTSFNQTIAETGRLSSSDPNLQNIPIRTEDGAKIRKAFIAEKGFKLLSADYSQIELRVLAHLSDDPVLTRAFQEDADVHRITASTIFGLSQEEVTSAMRGVAKTVNFAVIYGQTPFGLSQQLGIPPQKAKEYIDNYFAKYRKVQEYRDQVLSEAREKKEVRTLYGRRRGVSDLLSKNPNVRGFAERIAFNTIIQGTAADLIKLAMIRIDEEIRKQNLKSRMLLQVHDELVLEVHESELEKIKELVRKEMEGVAKLKVPIKVEVGEGPNWAEAH